MLLENFFLFLSKSLTLHANIIQLPSHLCSEYAIICLLLQLTYKTIGLSAPVISLLISISKNNNKKKSNE